MWVVNEIRDFRIVTSSYKCLQNFTTNVNGKIKKEKRIEKFIKNSKWNGITRMFLILQWVQYHKQSSNWSLENKKKRNCRWHQKVSHNNHKYRGLESVFSILARDLYGIRTYDRNLFLLWTVKCFVFGFTSCFAKIQGLLFFFLFLAPFFLNSYVCENLIHSFAQYTLYMNNVDEITRCCIV